MVLLRIVIMQPIRGKSCHVNVKSQDQRKISEGREIERIRNGILGTFSLQYV